MLKLDHEDRPEVLTRKLTSAKTANYDAPGTAVEFAKAPPCAGQALAWAKRNTAGIAAPASERPVPMLQYHRGRGRGVPLSTIDIDY